MSSLVSLLPVTTLSNNVIRILGMNPSPMTLQGTNTYLVGSKNKKILIDTGVGLSSYANLLENTCRENNFEIEAILLTHRHYDHTGGIKDVKNIFGDIPVYKYPDVQQKESYDYIPLSNSQLFSCGCTIQVIHTPGHTKDSVCFHLIEENSVFSGDTILGQGSTVFSDLLSYMSSLKLIQSFNFSNIYAAHGPEIVGREVVQKYISNYISHRNKRELEILSSLAVPRTAMEIVKIVYSSVDTLYHNAACGNVLLHLEKLRKNGLIESNSDRYEIDAEESIRADYLKIFLDIKWKKIITKQNSLL